MKEKDPNIIAFGERVKELRQSQMISQEELAHRCGFYRTYIGMVERAERSITLCNVYKIAKGLNVDIKTLFDNE
ncbi:MAG: helix-turn-helix domain-containing protein [Muribaculaceae bacterium]